MKLMMIITAFSVVTVGLLLMYPNSISRDIASIAEPSEMTKEGQPALFDEVTRLETSLLSVGTEKRGQDVSKLLRQPIRLDGRSRDIRGLSREILARFGYDAPVGDRATGAAGSIQPIDLCIGVLAPTVALHFAQA